MVDPITIGIGLFAVYKGVKSSKKAKERERERYEREEYERRETERRARERLAEIQAEAARVRNERAERERVLKELFQPLFTAPTLEEIEAVKYARQYDPNLIHIAVSGLSGSGKSSFVNAIRGLPNRDTRSIVAPTGITETTRVIGRYPVSDLWPGARTVMYDVPGAGTLEIPNWDYFKNQGLYIFDAIIVAFDRRISQADIAIVRACDTLNIPCLIVRSKSDEHIENALRSMPEFPSDASEDDENTASLRAEYLPTVCKSYVDRSYQSVADNLTQAGLGLKNVYVISASTMVSVVNKQDLRKSQILLDESRLLSDLSGFTPLRWRNY